MDNRTSNKCGNMTQGIVNLFSVEHIANTMLTRNKHINLVEHNINKGVKMHKYNKAKTNYKDVPMEDKIFIYLDKQDSNEADKLGMFLAHLSMPVMCCGWVSEEHFNNLLEKYKVDITPYVKDDERITTSIKSEIADEMFNLISNGKYKKRNLIKVLRDKFPNVNAGVIHRLIKKNMDLRILEIDRTYKTKPYVIKGKYYIGG